MRIGSILIILLFLVGCSTWTGVSRPSYRPASMTDAEATAKYRNNKEITYDCKSFQYNNQNINVCVGNRSVLTSSITDRMSGLNDAFGLEMLLSVENNTKEDLLLMMSDIRLMDDRGSLWSLRKWEFISLAGDSYNTKVYRNSQGGWLLSFATSYMSKKDRPESFTFYLVAYIGNQRLEYEANFKNINWPK